MSRNSDTTATTTLYRPVGPDELELIRASGHRRFPPRLHHQPFFCPVLNEEYACQIARDWNVRHVGVGYVTRFRVDTAYLERHTVQTVGSAIHQEYWIPAEELTQFNAHIVGCIEVVAAFRPPARTVGR